MTRPGAPVRLLLGGGAAVVIVVLGILEPLAAWSRGCPGTAATWAASAFAFGGVLAALALAPDASARALRRVSRVDPADPAHLGALVILLAALHFLLGRGTLGTAVATAEEIWGACALGATGAPSGDAAVAVVLVNAVVFVLPVAVYVAVVHGAGAAGVWRALGFRREGAPRAVGIGVLAAFAFLLALALVVGSVSPFVPPEWLENEQVFVIAKDLTWAGAILIAVGTGFGEEIFYRGFLQTRIGNVATSVLFTLGHANYASVSEVAVVFPLSLALGGLRRWTGNLFAPVAMHFAFNLVQLGFVISGVAPAG